MNRFLVVLVLLVVAVVGLGFYLGWFHVSMDSPGQKTNVTITVDQEKIQADEERASKKVQDVGQDIKQKTGQGIQKRQDPGPRP
jgi:hypothetical protein